MSTLSHSPLVMWSAYFIRTSNFKKEQQQQEPKSVYVFVYKFSSHQLLLMYTEDARKKGYTIEMTLSSTMLKEMAFRLHVGLRVK